MTCAGDCHLDRSSRVSRMPLLLLLASLSSIIAVALVPFAYPQADLDPSWQQAMVEATDSGRVFGRDLVFTYGPLHQAVTDQASRNLVPFIVARLFFTASWFVALLLVGLMLDWRAVACVAVSIVVVSAQNAGPQGDAPFYL